MRVGFLFLQADVGGERAKVMGFAKLNSLQVRA